MTGRQYKYNEILFTMETKQMLATCMSYICKHNKPTHIEIQEYTQTDRQIGGQTLRHFGIHSVFYCTALCDCVLCYEFLILLFQNARINIFLVFFFYKRVTNCIIKFNSYIQIKYLNKIYINKQ